MSGGFGRNSKRVNVTQSQKSYKRRRVALEDCVAETISQAELIIGPEYGIKLECDSSDEIDVKPNVDVIKNNVNSGSNDLAAIMQELKYLRKTVDELKTCCSELNSTVTRLIKQGTIDIDESISFPVKTTEELDQLDKHIQEETEKYNILFKRMVIGSRGKVEKTLKNIISIELALCYNFDGTHGMLPFKSYKNINSCLYNAIKNEVPSIQLYKQAVQQGFRRMKNLHFKRLSTKRKTEKEDAPVSQENPAEDEIITIE